MSFVVRLDDSFSPPPLEPWAHLQQEVVPCVTLLVSLGKLIPCPTRVAACLVLLVSYPLVDATLGERVRIGGAKELEGTMESHQLFPQRINLTLLKKQDDADDGRGE